jgi:ABC-type amino acid transport substrate-binding protein
VSGVNVQAGLAALPTGTTWEGLSVDLKRALAAAVLGDPSKVSFVVMDRKTGSGKVSTGETDLYLPVEPMALSKLASLGLVAPQAFFSTWRRVNAVSAEETELARLRAGSREEVGDALILPELNAAQQRLNHFDDIVSPVQKQMLEQLLRHRLDVNVTVSPQSWQ